MSRPHALRVPAPARVQGPLVVHEATVTAVSVGPDGRLLATGDAAGTLHLCDLEFGRRTFTVALGGPVRALQATSGIVVVGLDDAVVLVHGFGGRVVARHPVGGSVEAVAASPDGLWAAALAADAVTLLRIATGRVKATHPADGATALGFVDDRTVVLAGPQPAGRSVPRWAPVDADAALPVPTRVARTRHPSGEAEIHVDAGGAVTIVPTTV